MSRHHVAQNWSRHVRTLRPIVAAGLPSACVNCGRTVHASDTWHVAHVIDAAAGGTPTVDNVGAAHARCNLSAGGRAGAAVVNAAGRDRRRLPGW